LSDAKELPTSQQLLTVLAENPERIAALTGGLAPAQLSRRPRDGWSANDVLAHLRSCADVWGDYIAAMLAEHGPTLRGVDPRTWIKRTNYPELEFLSSLRSFAKQRADLLAVLEPLPLEGWSRGATITGGGSARQRTVHAYANSLARHERAHVKQIARIVESVQP
jgi:hypothetical protein